MKKITLLAPTHTLPSEGDDNVELAKSGGSPDSLENLLDFYASAVSYQGLDFVLDEEEKTYFSDGPESVYLQCIDIRADGDSESPVLDPRMAFCSVALPDELPVNDDSENDFEPILDSLRDSVSEASAAFRGTPVPLMCRRRGGDDAHETLRCLGLLLAEEEELDALGSSAESNGSTMSIVLDEDEVEGRGLREAVASAAVAALMLGSATTADAGLFFKRDKTTQVSAANERKASKSILAKRAAKKMTAKVDKDILAKAESGNTHILVDISQQKAFVLVAGQVAVETPVSTAREGKVTPTGEFTITEKIRTGKTSTIYGCELPCWMRLDGSAYGLHVGELPGYPASAGCVRLPVNIAPIIFDHAPSGTVVKIVDSLQPTNLMASL
ncbi:MAG: L,D-transpeptidase [Verrucomicrobiota bacterium]